MNRYNQSLSKTLTKKDSLLLITALSGEFPFNYGLRLDMTADYEKIIRYQLFHSNMVEIVKTDKLNGIRLTKKSVAIQVSNNPNRFKYMGDRKRKEKSRRIRQRLFAITYCSLLNADIEFLWDCKPYIFDVNGSPLLNTSILNDRFYFYSSTELKGELGDYMQQVRNSAMLGLILNHNECFILYNIHDNENPLSYATETKLSILVQNGNFLSLTNSSNAICLVKDFSVAEELILGNKLTKKSPSRIILNEVFKNIYIVPENSNGDIQLQALSNYEIRCLINEAFENDFGESNPNSLYINEGFDEENNPAIEVCMCNIVKLMKFKQSLLANDITGRILCFDFQMEFIQKIMYPAKIKLTHIKIQDVKEVIGFEE